METIDLQEALTQEINGFPVKNLGNISDWGNFDSCTKEGIYIFNVTNYYQSGILITSGSSTELVQKLIYTDVSVADIDDLRLLVNQYQNRFYSSCYAWRRYVTENSAWEPWNKDYLGLVDNVFIEVGNINVKSNIFDTIYQPGIYRFSTPNYYGSGILQVEITKAIDTLCVTQTIRLAASDSVNMDDKRLAYAWRYIRFKAPESVTVYDSIGEWQRLRSLGLVNWTPWIKISQI